MSLDHLAPEARLWAYAVVQPMSSEQCQAAEAAMAAFVPQWQTHGSPVSGGYAIHENRVLLMAAQGDVSGCSIDSSVKVIRDLRALAGIHAMDRSQVFYRNEGEEIVATDRISFQGLINDGTISAETTVIDTTITRLAEFREGKLERPARDTWFADAFNFSSTSTAS